MNANTIRKSIPSDVLTHFGGITPTEVIALRCMIDGRPCEMIDPIVIEPDGFDVEAAWRWHAKMVDDAGGMTYEDGDVNWRAAFSADPGCCSCPACGVHYWAFGRRQRCRRCGFEYPTDWWPMYSYGTQDARRISGEVHCRDAEINERFLIRIRERLAERMKHPYYAYGYANPVPDPHREAMKVIQWWYVFPESQPRTRGGGKR